MKISFNRYFIFTQTKRKRRKIMHIKYNNIQFADSLIYFSVFVLFLDNILVIIINFKYKAVKKKRFFVNFYMKNLFPNISLNIGNYSCFYSISIFFRIIHHLTSIIFSTA